MRRIVDTILGIGLVLLGGITRRSHFEVAPCAGMVVLIELVWQFVSDALNYIPGLVQIEVRDRDMLISDKNIEFLEARQFLRRRFVDVHERHGSIRSLIPIGNAWY